MNRLRRLFHRHRWSTLSVSIWPLTITTRACRCGEQRTNTTSQGD